MKDFTFYLPTRIEFGRGYAENTGKWVKELGAQRVIVVTDEGISCSPLFQKIKGSLAREKIEVILFNKVKANPGTMECSAGADLALREKADAVVALGGGSSMDCGKGIAGLMTNPGPISNIMKPHKLKNAPAPLICIPTTAGTGSEVTSFAVITIEEEKRKSSIFDDKIRPILAINDPELLAGLPAAVAAATGMDALTHAIEAYTCNLASAMTDGLAIQAIKQIAGNLRNMVYHRDEECCHNMMAGSLLAGIAFGFSDIAGVHCMAEALGGFYDTAHGVANSIFLPLVFEFNIPADVKKHRDAALAMGIDPAGKSDREIAQAGAEWLKELARDIEIPKLNELKYVKTEDFELLAEMCMKNVSLPSNVRKMTKSDFEKIYWKAYTS